MNNISSGDFLFTLRMLPNSVITGKIPVKLPRTINAINHTQAKEAMHTLYWISVVLEPIQSIKLK